MRRLLAAAAALSVLAAGAAQAASWKDFEGVTNTSWVEPNGDKVLQLSMDVPASSKAVWDAWVTSDGFRSWAVPVTEVDFRVDGVMESSYSPTAKLGDRDNIKNRIVAYIPGRMFAIRNVQAPIPFKDAERFSETATIIELEPRGPSLTKVTLTAVGYRPGEPFDTLYKHFEWGDAYMLAELAKRFEKGPVDWAKAAQQAKADAAVKTVEGRQP